MPVLNANAARMLQVASHLERIEHDVLAELGNYVTRNQNLNGTGFIGTASLQSVATSVDVSSTGKQVASRFDMVISQIRKAAAHYGHVNDQNRAAIAGVTTTA